MKLKNPALLTAAILLTINLPGAAPAAPNTAESEPVYLGAEEEFQSTLATMFDENGLRVGEPGEWQNFYDEIEGFTHQPGTRNVLRVNRYTVANPPADGSSQAFVLDMVVESELVKP